MSGIYISGMEMPTSCSVCELCGCYKESKGEVYRCDISMHPVKYFERRLDNCPLVPVPDHGRLIDADALMKILSKVIDINASIEQRNEATDQERRCLWWFEQQIGIAPTIIPAEEGEG